ncbi:MAG: pectate lyase [Treponema sp.]|nr:pectate lyase [Treponema sp.]
MPDIMHAKKRGQIKESSGGLIVLCALCLLLMSSCAKDAADSGVSDVTVTKEAVAEFNAKVSVHYIKISIADFGDGFNHARYQYPNSIPPWELYDEEQILGFAENMIYLQNPDGGWAKNLDFQRKFSLQELVDLQKANKSVAPVTYQKKTDSNGSTIDNGNIFSQIKYLAQVYKQVPKKRYLDCAVRALQWILNAQHPVSGGFTGADVYAITYNDDVMSETLRTLRNISRDDDLYGVFPAEMRTKAADAYTKGVECILKTQITLTLKDGTKILTAWCQQHSHDTLQPVWAREFEPPSVCTSESAKVVNLLMEDDDPSDKMKKAIVAACKWFDCDDVRIHGKKIVSIPCSGETLNGRYYDYERKMVDDASASDLWARFYALDSSFDVVTGARKPIQGTYPEVNTPIWCDRGCKYCETYNDMSKERRNGYGYTVTTPNTTLKRFAGWKQKFGI